MSDIKLFGIAGDACFELDGRSVALEKSLQTLIERHLNALLGVRFLASEYCTGKTHGGRMDTLGIDENGYPVIIEYKRSTNENVINQGLFYLDHRVGCWCCWCRNSHIAAHPLAPLFLQAHLAVKCDHES